MNIFWAGILLLLTFGSLPFLNLLVAGAVIRESATPWEFARCDARTSTQVILCWIPTKILGAIVHYARHIWHNVHFSWSGMGRSLYWPLTFLVIKLHNLIGNGSARRQQLYQLKIIIDDCYTHQGRKSSWTELSELNELNGGYWPPCPKLNWTNCQSTQLSWANCGEAIKK